MFNIPKVSLTIDDDYFYIDIALFHNVNILTGLSGAGKTALMSNLARLENDDRILNGIYNGENVDYHFYTYVSGNASHLPDEDAFYLILIDEEKRSLYDKTLTDYMKKARKAVFLIVSREVETGVSCDADCFAEAVYSCRLDDTGEKLNFYTETYLDSFGLTCSNIDHQNQGKYIVCVCEGAPECAEDKLYSQLFDFVVCCSGKDNVNEKVREVLLLYDYIYVIVDLCAFGSRFLELHSIIRESGKNVLVADMYCFEKCILDAVFPEMTDIDEISTDYVFSRNDNLTFEAYAYRLLSSMRYGYCNRFVKSTFPKAYYAECIDYCDESKRNVCNRSSLTVRDRMKELQNDKELRNIFLASKGGKDYV